MRKMSPIFEDTFLWVLVKIAGSGKKDHMVHISAYTQPTHFIVGTIKDADIIFYSTKNQVRGLCVGGDMVILFFLRLGGFYIDSFLFVQI